MVKRSLLKVSIVITLILFIMASVFGFFKILGADYGEVQPIWTKLSDELTYLKDSKGRLHLFPIRMEMKAGPIVLILVF